MDDFSKKTVYEVNEWLEDEGIDFKFCQILKENEIDGAGFLDLSEADIKEIIKPLGIVKHLLRLQKKVLPAKGLSLFSTPTCTSTPSISEDIGTNSSNLEENYDQSPSLYTTQTTPSLPGHSKKRKRLSSPEPESERSSLKVVTMKLESGIPSKFSIPKAWRSQIMDAIASKEMSPSVRNALVRDLVVYMYSFGQRPSRKFCVHAAQYLVLAYPCMRDAVGTGYSSWEQKIVDRVYNVEKGRKKDVKDERRSAGPASKSRKTEQSRYPPLEISEMDDEALYASNLDALNQEIKQAKPNKNIIKDLMYSTFFRRRQFILEDAFSVANILDKFPALKEPDMIIQEMELILKMEKDSLVPKFCKVWLNLWVHAINAFAGKVSSKTSKYDAYSDDASLRGIESLSILFTVLSRKEKKIIDPLIYVIEDYEVDVLPENAAKKKPVRNSPRIARFLIEDGEPLYYIFVEQMVLCQCPTLIKALLVWFSCHYTFNLVYHKYYHDMALFLQEFVLEQPDNGKKTANYLSMSTELKKLSQRLI